MRWVLGQTASGVRQRLGFECVKLDSYLSGSSAAFRTVILSGGEAGARDLTSAGRASCGRQELCGVRRNTTPAASIFSLGSSFDPAVVGFLTAAPPRFRMTSSNFYAFCASPRPSSGVEYLPIDGRVEIVIIS